MEVINMLTKPPDPPSKNLHREGILGARAG